MSQRSSSSTEVIDPLASASWPDQSIQLRENPERLAWIVILISFGILVALCFIVPASYRYIVRYATVSQEAQLQSTLGTLFYYSSKSSEPIAITTTHNDVVEGSRIEAKGDSTQGTLGFFTENELQEEELQQGVEVISIESFGSIQLYANTSVEIQRLRRPMFERSPEPYQVRLFMQQGQARVFTNSGHNRTLDVELLSPHGSIDFGVGTYQVSVTTERTNITVREGSATLSQGRERTLLIDNTQRAWMTVDDITQKSASEEQNLVLSAEFAEDWLTYVSREDVPDLNPGIVKFVENDGRKVAFFTRTDGPNAHTEVGISQEINKDVNVYDYLSLQFGVKILHQNLAGGGTVGTEFPLRVEITYTDIYGKQLAWGSGFYYLDPAEDDNPQNDLWPLADSEKTKQARWYDYQSPNLIDLWRSNQTPPARIDSIRIYASGHKYQSAVSEVYLLAQ
ncbi:hypothetical protein KFU94_57355 [Chloroflexi bacterium TSY]|nr:hypothetical protein [Chloroflexi bacterium TSY]